MTAPTYSDARSSLFDAEAEAWVIGSIILEPSLIDEVDIDTDDFFDDQLCRLFQAMLAIRNRDEHIDQISLAREVGNDVEPWVLSKIISEVPTYLDCSHYAAIVRDLSRRRLLVSIIDTVTNQVMKQTNMTTQEIVDKAKASLDMVEFPSKTSRIVLFSNPRMTTSEPPTYTITVTSANSKKSVDIRFTSAELDQPAPFKRKIRERLNVNPILPKPFDALVHILVRQAKTQFAPKDASGEENICFWVREWFKTAVEAEHPEDLTQGYINREGAHWFQSTRILKYLQDKAKTKLTPSSFWPVIEGRGGRKSKVFRLGESTVRLWGLNHSFFQAEEAEPMEEDQLPLTGQAKEIDKGEMTSEGAREDEDISWLDEPTTATGRLEKHVQALERNTQMLREYERGKTEEDLSFLEEE